MTIYVTDTHALLWYLGGSPQLSATARAAFDEALKPGSRVVVPAIVVAEAVMLAEKRRVVTDLSGLVATLKNKSGFEFASLAPEVALQTQSLTALRDIHDRLIVAETLARGATLITRDRAIAASGLVTTIW